MRIFGPFGWLVVLISGLIFAAFYFYTQADVNECIAYAGSRKDVENCQSNATSWAFLLMISVWIGGGIVQSLNNKYGLNRKYEEEENERRRLEGIANRKARSPKLFTISVEEAAKEYDVSPSTIRKWLREGEIEGHKGDDNRWYVYRD